MWAYFFFSLFVQTFLQCITLIETQTFWLLSLYCNCLFLCVRVCSFCLNMSSCSYNYDSLVVIAGLFSVCLICVNTCLVYILISEHRRFLVLFVLSVFFFFLYLCLCVSVFVHVCARLFCVCLFCLNTSSSYSYDGNTN